MVVGSVIFIVAVLNLSFIRTQLHKYKLVPEQEAVTELYFQNVAALPAQYSPGEPLRLSFTLVSQEHTQIVRYVITQTNEHNFNAKLSEGSARLDALHPKVIEASVIPGDSGPRANMAIHVTNNSAQNINYWITRR